MVTDVRWARLGQERLCFAKVGDFLDLISGDDLSGQKCGVSSGYLL